MNLKEIECESVRGSKCDCQKHTKKQEREGEKDISLKEKEKKCEGAKKTIKKIITHKTKIERNG